MTLSRRVSPLEREGRDLSEPDVEATNEEIDRLADTGLEGPGAEPAAIGERILASARRIWHWQQQQRDERARAERIERRKRDLPGFAQRQIGELVWGRLAVTRAHPSAEVVIHATDDELAEEWLPSSVWLGVTVGSLRFVVQRSMVGWWRSVLLVAPDCGQLHRSGHLETIADLGRYAERLEAEGCPFKALLSDPATCPGEADVLAAAWVADGRER